MSSASGLHLLRADQFDPLATTTFGTGEIIRVASEEFHVKRILLGIGGSATNDAGIGCAQACGLPVILEGGEPVSPTEPLCGGDVERVVLVKHGRGDHLGGVEIIVACDVTNPLFGPNGAAHVFGPQKGATHEVIGRLDRALEQLATRTGKLTEANTPGAGAAGGLGFGLLAFFGATLRPGIDIVIGAVRLRERLRGADLCLTGEGKIDAQSESGKAISGVARACREADVPCIALCGTVGDGAARILNLGISEVVPIRDLTMDLTIAMRSAAPLVTSTAENVVRMFISSRR
jgi:glycerate kinase